HYHNLMSTLCVWAKIPQRLGVMPSIRLAAPCGGRECFACKSKLNCLQLSRVKSPQASLSPPNQSQRPRHSLCGDQEQDPRPPETFQDPPPGTKGTEGKALEI